MMEDEVRLGIDVACVAAHQASLADTRGEFLWQGWRFKTTTTDLERLWANIPDGARVVVVMEPTRNAWVPLAAWFQARGTRIGRTAGAIRRSAGLFQQTPQDRPARLEDVGPYADVASRGPTHD